MSKAPHVQLTPEEQQQVDKGFDAIRAVMQKKNINIAKIIGLVTEENIKETSEQVKVRFAEETAAHMHMIAFD